jgi:Nickel responsive protein SCO4226-like
MKKYIVEREIPSVGSMTGAELCEAARTSNDALAQLAPKVQWQHSYVTGDKTFCIYLADTEADIQSHSELSGFPASNITEVTSTIDPTTGDCCNAELPFLALSDPDSS